MNWAMSMLLLTPFSYIHSRFIVRRFQNLTRNSYNGEKCADCVMRSCLQFRRFLQGKQPRGR